MINSSLLVPKQEYDDTSICDLITEDFESPSPLQKWRHVPDQAILKNGQRTAEKTLPQCLQMRRSKINPASISGVFAGIDIDKNIIFGPYLGTKIDNRKGSKLLIDAEKRQLTKGKGYTWEVFDNGCFSHFVDGTKNGNWMKFVQPALNKEHQTLYAELKDKQIWYRTTRQIRKGEELTVWYGPYYNYGYSLDTAEGKVGHIIRHPSYRELSGEKKKSLS